MKRLGRGVLGVIVIVGMLGSISVYAGSMATSMQPTENAQPKLTVVFGAPPAFDLVAATKSGSSDVKQINSAVVVQQTENKKKEPVPEPSTLVLVGIGVLGLIGLARRKRH